MESQKPAYFSFLLRLWQETSQGRLTWRASLENPHDGERLGFADLDELLVFISDITRKSKSVDDPFRQV